MKSTIMRSFWSFVIVLSSFTWKIRSLPSPTRILNSEKMLPPQEIGLPEIRDFYCYDVYDNPYIADIPHPYRCDLFIKCSPHPGPGGTLVPLPDQMACQEGPNGRLWFSMETCNCEYPEQAVCFDEANPTHVEQRFKCACPLIQDANGKLVDDDKCSHRHFR